MQNKIKNLLFKAAYNLWSELLLLAKLLRSSPVVVVINTRISLFVLIIKMFIICVCLT